MHVPAPACIPLRAAVASALGPNVLTFRPLQRPSPSKLGSPDIAEGWPSGRRHRF